ncbi:hypothetical protein BU24DRAFT_343309 [Aaosphaeria arxii CBS 175.79]|uniref:Tyrosine-protein phosphatase 2 n=1 Tax=Aaosphaeria arxii CBS 175.79 TaxID=1450172 RepID=A0A6A5XZI4_9PLEO|nr:uncharacterized protein BU24DRAFT_343309 [Aaosphaeria arxii CBS 175.79]KAF2018313.1 hypothetical protein BU24DRAFT_343309 [Aaosphaeria arxii CBS 175.79]
MSSTGSLAVPPSPSSSKRSRSRDSSRSAAASSVNTPFVTPSATPSASAPSLLIPQSSSQTSSLADQEPPDLTPYPAFLQLKIEILEKYQDLEWQQRERLLPNGRAVSPTSQWAKCTGPEVAQRNRYVNVDPYQNNRVKLQVPEGYSDYINASPIVLESTKTKKITRFIATQGPKPESFSHIWRMIWEQTTSPAVAIMLTKTHEGGREKCFAYYPQSLQMPDLRINAHDEFKDGIIHNLHLASLVDNEEVSAQVRELDMSTEDGSETKKIWHLLFEGWPDFSVPEDANQAALLKLIDLSRERNADNANNPRIVHCSAGVGRSGTFIALDWLLQELEEGSMDNLHEDDDPILTVVDNLRLQRMMMVQSEAQFIFLYDVIRERWRDRWVKQNPEEADRLGLDLVREPRHKRARPSREIEIRRDDDAHAELEAELVGNQMEFEHGRT